MSLPILLLRTIAGAAIAALLAPSVGVCADGQQPPGVAETTEVFGQLPGDLAGRWLIVNQIKLPSGERRSYPHLWEIRRGPQHVEVVLMRVEVPAELAKKVQDSGNGPSPWTPGADDLHMLDERWDQLPATNADYAKIEHKLYGADAFTGELQADDETKNSKFALLTKETFSGAQPVKSTISVYGFRESGPSGATGSFVVTSIAAAPLPIPITLKGDFQTHRVGAPPPPPSMLQRMLDFFSGCRRG